MDYCTYFDKSYLDRGLNLYHSLQAQSSEPVRLWALCLDSAAYDVITAQLDESIRPISLGELEDADPELAATRSTRTFTEYLFTCTAAWCLYLLKRYPEISRITYLDSDLFFFADPVPIFDEMSDASILIIPHRFPKRLKHLEQFGIYNVGLLSFRNDAYGMECLEWWRARCIEWCFDRIEDGKYADQKYLDDWPARFRGVHIVEHKGANLAPWNWMNYTIRRDDKALTVDGLPLIFYHFQGLKLLAPRLYDPGTFRFGPMPRKVRTWLYDPYIEQLRQSRMLIRTISHDVPPGYSGLTSRDYSWRSFALRFVLGNIVFLSEPL